jgi:hypothetical protein
MNRITFSRWQAHTQRRRPAGVRLELELLEARNLLNGTPTNVLVNNPAEDTIPKQDTQSETAIVLGANSNVVVAYNDTGAVTYPSFANLSIAGYAVSANAGTSFTDQGNPPASGPYWGGFDQVLARSNKTGTIFLSNDGVNTNQANLVGERVNIFRSLDNGATFSPSLNGTPGFVAGVDEADKPWIAVDNNPGPGYGNAYLAWTDFTFKNDGSIVNKGIYFTRSTDDGQTWGPCGGVPIDAKPGINAVQGGFVTIGPDHTVYVIWWYGGTSQNILMSKSTDQGQTFSQPVLVTRLNTNGNTNGDLGLTYSNTNNSSFRAFVFPQAAVNPVNGDLYVVYNDKPKDNSKDKADIFFTMSSDGGNTWSSPLRVNDDATTTDQWQPAIAVTPDGTHLFVTWYDRRNDPSNDSLIDRYGEIATVSGHTVSFAPNFRITDVSFPPAFGQDSLLAAFGHSDYMGDYDMAVADNHYFYTTWGDNRLGDASLPNQPDVRFAKIPVSGEEAETAVTAPRRSGATLTVSATPTPVALSAGAVPSGEGTRARDAGVDGSTGSGGLAETVADPLFAMVGDEVALGAHPTPQAVVVNGLPSTTAALPRFDALLAMGASARTMGLPKDNGTRDLLFASLS